MKKTFHEEAFDPGTLLKLSIFRGYIREWISVFMTESLKTKHVTSVNIFDLFAGPGGDISGENGSPQIIVNEIKAYCESQGSLKSDKPIRMYFNDIDHGKIKKLQSQLSAIACGRDCCKPVYLSQPFSEVLEILHPIIAAPGSANLVILDQFGISDVTPEVVQRLAVCSQTDVLFFFPSSFVKRFQKHPAFISKYDLRGKDIDYKTVHRAICEHFREKMGNTKYHLAPFSIQKNKNIYGVIFGSANLHGLEKFLNVCWKIDAETGEANFNMEGDLFWGKTPTLFDEVKTFRKIDQFEADLMQFIETSNPDNLMMYAFCLEKGFSPHKAKESLDRLQEVGRMITISQDGGKGRKGAFYLNYSEKASRIRFQKGEGAP